MQCFVPEWRELGANASYNLRIRSRPLRCCTRICGMGNNMNQKTRGHTGMGRIIKAVLALAVVAFAALTGYAYLADLSPEQAEVTKPVVLNAD
jgi:hypothetical protein